MVILVVVLALVAAGLYAVSDFLEQRAASRAAAGGAMRRMVKDPKWMAGWCVGTLAYGIQALALYLGTVLLVQLLQVTTLLFSLRLASIGRPERAGLREYLGGGAVVLGLGLLLAVMAAAIVVLAAFSRLRAGAFRAVTLALGAGIALGCCATLVKLTTADLTEHGVPGTAADWPGYLLAVATATGVVLQQIAFGSGRLPTATTAMLVANPLVGTIISVLGFGQRLPSSPGALLGIALGGLVIAAGVAILSTSPLLHGSASDRDADLPAAAQGPAAPDGGVRTPDRVGNGTRTGGVRRHHQHVAGDR